MSDDNVNATLQPAAVAEEPSRKQGIFWRFRHWLMGLTRRQRLLGAIGAVVVAIATVLAILAWYLIFRQPITQLPGLNVTLPPVFSYSISDVSRPLGVAIDEENARLYVTQSAGSRTVKVFDLEGNPLGELPAPPDAGMHTSTYVAVDPTTQDVYVTDRGTNRVYVYSSDFEYVGTLKPRGKRVWGPLAIAIDAAGNIYVADAGTSEQFVWMLRPDGEVVRKIGEGSGLSFVNGLTVLEDGSLLVADSNNTRVMAFAASGEALGALARGEAEAPLGLIRGLAVGPGARLYVVDTTNSNVRVYRTDDGDLPTYATVFGEIGQMDGQFLYPNGIAADEHGRIYVTDRENNRLQVWTNR